MCFTGPLTGLDSLRAHDLCCDGTFERRKVSTEAMLRIFGATAGGILAFVAHIFILPRVQYIGGFTLALAEATFCATWVFTSSPRIAYAGRQMAPSY